MERTCCDLNGGRSIAVKVADNAVGELMWVTRKDVVAADTEINVCSPTQECTVHTNEMRHEIRAHV